MLRKTSWRKRTLTVSGDSEAACASWKARQESESGRQRERKVRSRVVRDKTLLTLSSLFCCFGLMEGEDSVLCRCGLNCPLWTTGQYVELLILIHDIHSRGIDWPKGFCQASASSPLTSLGYRYDKRVVKGEKTQRSTALWREKEIE